MTLRVRLACAALIIAVAATSSDLVEIELNHFSESDPSGILPKSLILGNQPPHEIKTPGLGDRIETLLGEEENEVSEIGEATQAVDAAGLKVFKQKFKQVAEGLQSKDLKESALMLEQTSVNAKMQRKGLKLIFDKLNALVEKTKDEEKVDTMEVTKQREECQTNLGKAGNIIGDASSKEEKNNLQMKEDHSTIMAGKQEWETSRNEEDKIQEQNVATIEERSDEMSAAKDRIDERNKAIDVMVKATFIVCGKFRRFMNTIACKSIKSRPDVNEPGQPVFPPSPSEKLPKAWHNSTGSKDNVAKFKKDKSASKSHAISQADAWTAMYTKDEALEGNRNPENLPMHEVVTRGSKNNEDANDEESESGGYERDGALKQEAKPEGSDRDALAAEEAKIELKESKLELKEDDSVNSKTEALSDAEKPALNDLKKLSKIRMDSKYSLPIKELTVALGEGGTKKSKNIVEILLDVKGITEDEQRRDKEGYIQALDNFYKRTWELKNLLNNEQKRQQTLEADMEERRLRMKETQRDTEQQLNMIATQSKVRIEEEDRCSKIDEQYGIRCAVRAEDLENIAKLVSLLRTLYDKIQPVSCKKSATVEPKMCTHEDNGWCIWINEKSQDQRCSCNVGFYGDVCEHKMCPGMGQTLYRHDQDGVCSNQGTCDPQLGECSICKPGFYNGPKQACELTHCPASMSGLVDEQCSGHGSCDIKRGKCSCVIEWSGAGCGDMKCPNSNTVLYRFESPNACDGRGACDPKTGKCACPAPYLGKACSSSDCPRNCMQRGGCDKKTGKCNCRPAYVGHACEFQVCDPDCGEGGECNRHTGKCICKDGYSGDRCRKSTRCSLERRNPAGEVYAMKEVDWYSIWDKPGWATCPIGQSIYALRRSACDALDCLEAASCAAPCEGTTEDSEVIQTRHCYHDLNVYGSFDKEGWSKCEPNYYVGGFYRSGSSLYQLQMFKCCSYKASRWSMCTDISWASKFNAAGWAKVPNDKFLTGLYRSKGHRLRNIDQAHACGWVRGY